MRAFVDTLKDIREGNLLNELAGEMGLLVEAVKTTGKKGKLTITLELSAQKGIGVLVRDRVSVTAPEPERDDSTFFFVTDENDLSRRDPRQPKLPEMGPRPVAQMPAAERVVDSNG